jgi:hypothetical protein
VCVCVCVTTPMSTGVAVVASRSEVTGFMSRNGNVKWTHSLNTDR